MKVTKSRSLYRRTKFLRKPCSEKNQKKHQKNMVKRQGN